MSKKTYFIKERSFMYRMVLYLLFMGCFAQANANQLFTKQNNDTGLLEKQISVHVDNTRLEQVLDIIQQQVRVSFSYNPSIIEKRGSISIDYEDANLGTVLNRLFPKDKYELTVVDHTIIVKLRPRQPRKQQIVSGKVVDKKGLPIPGTTVLNKNTEAATATDEQGGFQLPAEKGEVLRFSFIGFKPLEVTVGEQLSIDIVLKMDAAKLDEAVVIGYGTTTKRLNTGAVTTISSEELGRQPVANAMNALPGRIPGVMITQNNGIPGSNTAIQIRGQGSLNAGTIPLYVIDGVPYTNFNGAAPANNDLNAWGISGANGGTSPFSSINPTDIKSITILKDADATAIYGARGANGVILITTKSGSAGKPKIDVNIYSGFGKVGYFIPMLNTEQYLALRKEAFQNDGIDPVNAPTRPIDILDWSQTGYTDWQKLLIGGTAPMTNANFSFSGGTKNTQYRLSGGYRHDGTVYRVNNWKNDRITARFGLNYRSDNNKLKMDFSASYAHEKTFLPSSDMSSAYTLPPNYPLQLTDSSGKMIWHPGFTNPLSYFQQTYNGSTNNVIGNFVIQYRVAPRLNLKLNSGYTNILLDQRSARPASSINPAYNQMSTAYFSTNKVENWIVEPTANYTLSLGKGELKALVGGTFQQNISKTSSTKGNNYSSDLLLGSLVGAGVITSYFPHTSQYKFASFYSRINYNWDNKYLLNATFRRDASSRFGPNNRLGNFWAIGTGWVFSEEQFIRKQLPFLSFGKLKASYGLTGNDQISDYIYLPLYSVGSTSYQDQTSYYQRTLPNPDVQWETNKKLNIGLELGFINDRIMFTGDYYRNRSGNQLTYLALPTQTGYNSYPANIPAVIQNTGVELQLNTKNIISRDFNWSTSFNITFPKNKLVSFPGLENSFYSNRYEIGLPITLTKLYDYTGIDPETGFPQFATERGTGTPDYNTDRHVAPIGTPFFGGMSNVFNYKNWSMNVFVQFNHKKGYTNGSYYSPIGMGMANLNTSALDRWHQPGNGGALFPIASAVSGSDADKAYGFYYASSDAFWGDASWLKIRSASISYTFTKDLLNKLGLSNLRVYAQGQNLLTLNKNKYQWDSETSVPGGPGGLGSGRFPAVPPLRTIVFGLNFSF